MISNFKSRSRGFTVLEALCMMVAVVLLGWLTLALVKNHFKPPADAAKPTTKKVVPAPGSPSTQDDTPTGPTSRAGSDAPAPAAPNP
jgi:cytoskeletal protein RodZ